MNERHTLRELVEAALIGLAVFAAIQFAIVNFKVEGSSMHPTLLPGYYLMVGKLEYFRLDTGRLAALIPFWQPAQTERIYLVGRPERGDMIVFDYPQDTQRQFVKRIIGEPGDTVSIANGIVSINGVPLDEPWLQGPGFGDLTPVRLRDSEYFVLGDNRAGSRDSRHWGPLESDYIIGRVWAIYWPQSAWGIPR